MKKITILFLFIVFASNIVIAQSFQYNYPRDKSSIKGSIKSCQNFISKKVSLDTTQIHGFPEKGMTLYSTTEFNEVGVLKLEKITHPTEGCFTTKHLLDEQNNLIYKVSGPCDHPFFSSETNRKELLDQLEINNMEEDSIELLDYYNKIGINTYKYDFENSMLFIYTNDKKSPGQILTFNEKNQVIVSEWPGEYKTNLIKKYNKELLVEEHFDTKSKMKIKSKHYKYDNQGREISRIFIFDPDKIPENHAKVDSIQIDYTADDLMITKYFRDGVLSSTRKELVFQKKPEEDLPTFQSYEEIDPEIERITYKDEVGNTIKTYFLKKNRLIPISLNTSEIEYYDH